MRVDVIMPQLGETVAEGTVTNWYKQVGDPIGEQENLFDVETDKVATEIPSPAAGVVEAALGWASFSDGRFDPAIGASSELWDVVNRHEPPDVSAVHRLAARGFWRHVDIDAQGRGARVHARA